MTQTDKDVHISNINSAKKKKKDNWFLHSSRFYLKVTKKVKFFCINNTVISLKTENVQL